MEKPIKEKILITGILGFTGRHLESKLRHLGYDVFGISQSIPETGIDRDKVFKVDIKDLDAVNSVLQKIKPNVIFHLAGNASSVGDRYSIYNDNVIGTENLLMAVTNLKYRLRKIIIASSAAVYGNSVELCSEDNLLMPVSHYGCSKLSMERIARNYFDKLNIIITRPFNYTGIGQNPFFLVPKIVDHFRSRKGSIQLGNMDTFREYNDIDFVVDCYVHMMNSEIDSEEFNLCTGEVHSIQEIIDFCTRYTGHTLKIEQDERFMRKNEIKSLRGNPDKLFNSFDLDNKSSNLENLLKRMLDE